MAFKRRSVADLKQQSQNYYPLHFIKQRSMCHFLKYSTKMLHISSTPLETTVQSMVVLKPTDISLYISLPYTLLSTSFLVCSSDKHYSTSQHQCGLDLSMTRQFFEKLSRKEKVLKEVAFKFILFAQFTTI